MKKQETSVEQILRDFDKMKQIARKYYVHKNWEKALKTIFFASGFMFYMNQIQYDVSLEKLLEDIVKENFSPVKEINTSDHILLYYDSFGQINRGLTQIYLKGLSSIGYRIIYVTFDKFKKVEQDVLAYVQKEDIYFISETSYLYQIKELIYIVKKSCASRIFMCLMPDDIVAVGAFTMFDGVIQRYQINLTDHAFWLGRNISDIVINFREFGARVTSQYRHIDGNKNVYLPYYPNDFHSDFMGLEFLDKNRKIVFSGGNLYKTLSKDLGYYILVEKILQKYDVDFVYFGDGDAKEMKRLCKNYPDRIFFSRERKDFFEVLKRSVFYLSTYPYNGGLMTQYALLAKKVPVTLCSTGIEPELSIRNEDAFWNYYTTDEVLAEIGKLLGDEEYRNSQENNLSDFLIDEQQFATELENIIVQGKSLRKYKDSKVDISGFLEQPRWYYQGFRYNRLFFRKDGLYLGFFFPFKYVQGAIGRIIERINNGK